MNYKTKIVDGHEVSFSSEWIAGLESEMHFNWYFHQAELVYSNCSRDSRMLEIGVGTSLLSDLLKRRGWDIRTLDIDEDKSPDFCGSAVTFGYKEHSIQVVLAFEIFEHIPFSTFKKTIEKLAGQGIKEIYFSLPWNERRLFELNVKLPKLRKISWSLDWPSGKITTCAHFWELGRKAQVFQDGKELVTLKTLTDVLSDAGYMVTELKKIGCIQYFSAKST